MLPELAFLEHFHFLRPWWALLECYTNGARGADRRTPYESVVRAMDATAQLGLVQMSLATSQPENGGE